MEGCLIGEAAARVGVCVETLRNWERSGKVGPVARIARTGQRLYTDADIERLIAFRDELVPA